MDNIKKVEDNSETDIPEIIEENCQETSYNDNGELLKCRKKNFWVEKDSEYIPHAGGHFYSTDKTYENWKDRANWHFDNEALLSFRPAASHAPEDCDQTGFCSWRKYSSL